MGTASDACQGDSGEFIVSRGDEWRQRTQVLCFGEVGYEKEGLSCSVWLCVCNVGVVVFFLQNGLCFDPTVCEAHNISPNVGEPL